MEVEAFLRNIFDQVAGRQSVGVISFLL